MEKEENNEVKPSVFETKAPMTTAELISFATEVGFSIAIPLAGFVFVGVLLDKNLKTSPLCLIIGLILSLISTSIILLTKIKKFLK